MISYPGVKIDKVINAMKKKGKEIDGIQRLKALFSCRTLSHHQTDHFNRIQIWTLHWEGIEWYRGLQAQPRVGDPRVYWLHEAAYLSRGERQVIDCIPFECHLIRSISQPQLETPWTSWVWSLLLWLPSSNSFERGNTMIIWTSIKVFYPLLSRCFCFVSEILSTVWYGR